MRNGFERVSKITTEIELTVKTESARGGLRHREPHAVIAKEVADPVVAVAGARCVYHQHSVERRTHSVDPVGGKP